jgi:hypothetical protein
VTHFPQQRPYAVPFAQKEITSTSGGQPPEGCAVDLMEMQESTNLFKSAPDPMTARIPIGMEELDHLIVAG